MVFYKYLLIDPAIPDIETVKEKLRREEGMLRCTLLCLNPDPETPHPIEILHAANLQQPYYRENPPHILGIAATKKKAIEMLRQLMQDCVQQTGKTDLVAYLFPHGIHYTKAPIHSTQEAKGAQA